MSANGLENFANILTVLAALGGVVAAWFGLFTWKAQALWNDDSGVAKAILVLLYKHNDALKNVRHRAIWSDEIDEATKNQELPKDQRLRRFHETSAVYNARRKRVQAVRAELYPFIIEGQALWGNEFKGYFSNLWKLEHELANVVRLHLEQMDPDHDSQTRQELAQIRRKKRDLLYLTDEAKDDFIADYELALQPIEDVLRQKLGRKK